MRKVNKINIPSLDKARLRNKDSLTFVYSSEIDENLNFTPVIILIFDYNHVRKPLYFNQQAWHVFFCVVHNTYEDV